MSIRSSRMTRAAMIALLALSAWVAGCPEVTSRSTTRSGAVAGQGQPLGEAITSVEVLVEGDGRVEQMPADRFIVLQAFPEAGWRFDGWIGIPSSGNPVTIIPTADLVLGARFVPAQTTAGPATVTDADEDGVDDTSDGCPGTAAGAVVDAAGCASGQLDGDGDGVSNEADTCPGTAIGLPVDESGCAPGQRDDDGDGITNASDQCSNTPAGQTVNLVGCAASQLDSDNDTVSNDIDDCPGTPPATAVDDDGCPLGGSSPPGGGGGGGGGSPAMCGNGTIEAGEQCEPPGTATCSATCQIIVAPPPPPPPPGGGPTAGPATWSSTQFLFDQVSFFVGFYGPPEEYTLNASGVLVSAEVSPDEATILDFLGPGDITTATTVPLGTPVELYTVTDVGFVATGTGTIDVFSLVLDGASATWTFDYTFVDSENFDGDIFEFEVRFVGEQTGTVNAAGTEIDWNNVSGMAFVSFGGLPQPPAPLEQLGLALGTWTRN